MAVPHSRYSDPPCEDPQFSSDAFSPSRCNPHPDSFTDEQDKQAAADNQAMSDKQAAFDTGRIRLGGKRDHAYDLAAECAFRGMKQIRSCQGGLTE